MTTHKTLGEIKSSLMNRIEQHSNKENLEVVVQIEGHGDLYDVAVLLYGVSGALLVDEVYIVGVNESEAITDAQGLLSNVMEWTADVSVGVSRTIKEVAH